MPLKTHSFFRFLHEKSKSMRFHPKNSRPLKKVTFSLMAGIATGLLIFGLSLINGISSQYIEQLERVFYDLIFKLKYVHTIDQFLGQPDSSSAQLDSTAEQRIIVVDIDERALSRLGAYNSWTRTNHAKVIQTLSDGGAASITFDILFKTADFGVNKANEAVQVMKHVKPEISWPEYFDPIRYAYNYDSVLIHSIRDARNVIVAATLASRTSYEHQSQWAPLTTPLWQEIIGTQGTLDPDKIDLARVTVWDLLDNIFPELANASHFFGLVNVLPDNDGVHRREPLFHAYPNPELAPGTQPRYYPIIAVQTLCLLFGIHPNQLEIVPGQYVNFGKPLGIYRDSSDQQLHTTYPHLTWPMLQAMRQHKGEIQKLIRRERKIQYIDIAHQVIIDKDSNGMISAEVNHGQLLSSHMLQYILQTPHLDSIISRALQGEEIQLDSQLVIGPAEEENRAVLMDLEEDEETVLTPYTLKVLREGIHQIHQLPRGKRLYLSCNLELRRDPLQDRILSNFIILNPSVIQDLLNTPDAQFDSLQTGSTIRLGREVRVPVDEHLSQQVNYTGIYDVKRNKRAFKQISYYDVMTQRIDPAVFQGKVFILGSTAPSLFDLISAPHASEFPGVLIHATLLENVLNNNFLYNLDNKNQLLVILVLALFCALMANLLPPLFAALLILMVLIGYFLTGMVYFDQGIYLGMARQILTILGSFAVIIVIRYVFETREKRFLNNAFKQYISPELIDMMVENEVHPSLGGTEGIFTAYFTDIAGFSTFSEAIGEPERLVELLNEYLGAMTDLLTQDRGTLDKYIGDAIVAIFGAPVQLQDHAQRACIVSLKMQQELGRLREKWKQQGDKWPPLVHQMKMRIGINTGPMVVGNMGSSMRMNYTMMGDTVNLAARLESAAKQYGLYIHVSDETLKNLPEQFILSRPVDLLQVIGKTEPVLTHELLCFWEERTPELEELVHRWNQARQAYLDTNWQQAIELFEKCLPLEPFHPDRYPGSKTCPSQVFLDRCKAYQKNPPVPEGHKWDGVYIATSK